MVSAGKRHSSAITQNNEIYCWGFNFYDQLGISGQMRFVDEYTTKFIIRPVKLELPSNAVQVACGEFHTLALLEK
jgi:alpha-tubulin suppressor-like RCC1 family protein